MTLYPGLQPWQAPAPLSFGDDLTADDRPYDGRVAPILIQVPAVRSRTRPARRPSASARVRAYSVQPGRTRSRRRLRREVRWASYSLLAVLALALATLRLGGQSAEGVSGGRVSARVKGEGLSRGPMPPAVWISIVPADPWKAPDREPPVVLPGYLLPDDGDEEPAHAGG